MELIRNLATEHSGLRSIFYIKVLEQVVWVQQMLDLGIYCIVISPPHLRSGDSFDWQYYIQYNISGKKRLSIWIGSWFSGTCFVTSWFTHGLCSSYLEGCNFLTWRCLDHIHSYCYQMLDLGIYCIVISPPHLRSGHSLKT